MFSSANSRGENAEALVSKLFESNGWQVQVLPANKRARGELIVKRGKQHFVVEIKALAEGRADRVIPLLSQAILQAQAHAFDAGNAKPLAVICVEEASPSLLKQIRRFVEEYVQNVAVGIVSESGLRYFHGALEELNRDPELPRRHVTGTSSQTINLFSDLNQWMLKVLLAPEIPERLLGAPRQKYQNSAELASAAGVSPMSAFRLVQQLRNEGYVDDASRYLSLVRREELFRRWRSAAMRASPELPMRFLIRGNLDQQIHSFFAKQEGLACLGLFAAADALHLGHVNGVPPYVYVPKLPRSDDKKWKALEVALPQEKPDIIVRQAASPKSAFRGAVHQDDLIVADVIQVWLDVANHPARGEEQASLIYEKILRPLIRSGN